MQNVEINSETLQSLLDAVNELFPGKVDLQFIGKLQNGYVRHDQAQAVQDKDHITYDSGQRFICTGLHSFTRTPALADDATWLPTNFLCHFNW